MAELIDSGLDKQVQEATQAASVIGTWHRGFTAAMEILTRAQVLAGLIREEEPARRAVIARHQELVAQLEEERVAAVRRLEAADHAAGTALAKEREIEARCFDRKGELDVLEEPLTAAREELARVQALREDIERQLLQLTQRPA